MNISLIGMMGSGKSTIGKLLKIKLSDYRFIDTDEEIIKKENMSINEIFAQKGEEYFRRIETEVLNRILSNNNQIISTGGGIIKSEENIKNLKEKSIVFYLKAEGTELCKRVKNNKERPLLNVENMYEKIKILLNEREKNYKQAHYIISTDNKTPEEITNEITGIINDNSRS